MREIKFSFHFQILNFIVNQPFIQIYNQTIIMTTDESIITYVNPYKLPESNNSELISLLQNGNTSNNQTTTLNFNIPVFKSIDVSNLIDLNNNKIESQINEQKRSQNVNINNLDSNQDENKSSNESNVVELNNEDLIIDEKLNKFIPIEEFKFKNFHNQLSSIIIKGIPNDLKLQVLEKLLNLLISNRSFKWSLINNLNNKNNITNDLKLIFIKFDQLVDLKWFLETYSTTINDIIPGCNIIKNDLIKDNLESLKIEPEEIKESLKSTINLIINNSKNKEIKKVTGLEDLDQVLDSYSNYKVDNNDLIDIPNDMKESIVKDIIKFRSRMLLIEKDLRKREIEQERINTKNKLKRLFEGIKESNETGNNNGNGSSSFSTTTTSNDGNNKSIFLMSNREEFEDMNDEEYEKYLKDQQALKLEEEYNQRLKEWEINQNKEYKKLNELLKNLQNYENQLIDNKLKFIDDFKNYQNLSISNLYNHKYNDYLKFRSKKRSLEEQQDELDRSQDHQPQPQLEEQQKPIIKQDQPVVKKLKVESIIINELSKELKSKLNDKIIELVEEYLGVKDEFLVQVINDNLQNSSLSKKKELIEELVEVLDEDSENLVNDLWKYIEKLS